MALAQSGDETAYASLLTELAGVIRAYVISRFGRTEILEDCVQECLLAIHQARHTYNAERPFRPWLFAIVRHRTIDILRQTAGRERIPDFPRSETDTTDPAEALDNAKLLGVLSKNLRDALLLTKIQGLSTRECALRLGVSESVVKVRVYRGIRKLRATWNAESL